MKESKPPKRISDGNQKHLFAPDLKIGDRVYVKGNKTMLDPEEEGLVFQVEKFYPFFAVCRRTGRAGYRKCFSYFDIFSICDVIKSH